jgi:predicted RNase H-like HicB family nuclease
MSGSGLEVEVTVPVKFKHEADWIVAVCDVLDVASQGRTEEEATENIIEALTLFFESCYRRNTLLQVLREAGLEPPPRPRRQEGTMPRRRSSRAQFVRVPLELIVAQTARSGGGLCNA